jgi:hypothetical protein
MFKDERIIFLVRLLIYHIKISTLLNVFVNKYTNLSDCNKYAHISDCNKYASISDGNKYAYISDCNKYTNI